jgi:hypothetical protein
MKPAGGPSIATGNLFGAICGGSQQTEIVATPFATGHSVLDAALSEPCVPCIASPGRAGAHAIAIDMEKQLTAAAYVRMMDLRSRLRAHDPDD